jgi:hypothetical protein
MLTRKYVVLLLVQSLLARQMQSLLSGVRVHTSRCCLRFVCYKQGASGSLVFLRDT